MTDCCDNICISEKTTKRQKRTLVIVLVINLVMFLAVLISALISNSSALLSGSIDNLGDSITYGLSLYAAARGQITKAKVSLFKGSIILFAAISVTVQLFIKIQNPETPIFELMGVMTIFSLLANFTCLVVLWEHKNEDINMASVWECSRNDVIENMAVLLAAVGVWHFNSGWPDIFIAALLVVILYRSGIRIVKKCLKEINSRKHI